MKPVDTILDLFVLAIAAEKAAMNFYKGLARSFSHLPEAAHFWEDLSRDEALHMQELIEIRNTLSENQLGETADPWLVEKAQNELKRFTEKFDLKAVVTLDDAYDIAYELEYSEVNEVFQALVNRYVSSDTRTSFVLSHIREHVSKLEDFSKRIADAETRRTILAQWS